MYFARLEAPALLTVLQDKRIGRSAGRTGSKILASRQLTPKVIAPGATDAKKVRHRAAFIGIGVCAIALLTGLSALWLISYKQAEQARELATFRAQIIGERMTRALFAAEKTAKVLAQVLPPSIATQEDFERISSDLKDISSEPIVLQWAPAAVVRFSYPLVGNESAIGLNLRADSRTNDWVNGVISSGKGRWDGPFTLRQGGTGAVFRLPVYRDMSAPSEDSFVGLISCLVNFSVSVENLAKELSGYTVWVSVRHDQGQPLPAYGASPDPASRVTGVTTVQYAPIDKASGAGIWLDVSLTPRALSTWGDHWQAWLGISLLAMLMGLLAFAMQSRRTGKAALMLALEQQQAMLNNETAGIVLARNRRIQWANRAFELMMGYGPGEMNGMLTRDNFPDEASFLAFGEACYPMLSAGGTYREEIQHRRKDGSIIHLDISVHKLGTSGAESIWTMIDVSERKTAQERLRAMSETRLAQSEARLKRMVALSKAWYWETDSELRFTQMGNAGPEPELTPMPLDRFRAITLGKRRWEIEGIEAVSETWEEHRARLAARQTFLDFEYTITVGNEQRWVQISGEPMFDSNGQFTGYSGVGKDVTDERLAEKQLREMQKAELIGQLTGGLAHDFRNMLNVMLGSLDQLEETLAQKGVTSLKPLATARTAALNGVGVTDSLLSVARQQPLQLQRCDLNVLIGEMEPLVKTAVGGSVRVILDLLPQALQVKVDAAGLSNVILNLAVNARDAMQGQPREQVITLRSQRTNLNGAMVAQNMGLGPGEYAVLEVSDSGPGMSPEVLSKAFNPFFTTKPPGKGTGLGLSMVYGFAQQLGGKASIGTELGVGTTIRIYLPLDPGEAVQENKPPAAAPGPLGGAGRPLRVLVVDDQAELCELACTWLEALGHRPLGSHSAEEAVGQIEPGRFDVLFTDVMMPAGMDGITLAREGQRRDPGLQVVFASGNTAVIPRGAHGQPELAVAKPYRKSDLLKVFGSTR